MMLIIVPLVNVQTHAMVLSVQKIHIVKLPQILYVNRVLHYVPLGLSVDIIRRL